MVHSNCRWTCGCAGKTVKSLENMCHTWALLWWWFTTKRRYIKCMHTPYKHFNHHLFQVIAHRVLQKFLLLVECIFRHCYSWPWLDNSVWHLLSSVIKLPKYLNSFTCSNGHPFTFITNGSPLQIVMTFVFFVFIFIPYSSAVADSLSIILWSPVFVSATIPRSSANVVIVTFYLQLKFHPDNSPWPFSSVLRIITVTMGIPVYSTTRLISQDFEQTSPSLTTASCFVYRFLITRLSLQSTRIRFSAIIKIDQFTQSIAFP